MARVVRRKRLKENKTITQGDISQPPRSQKRRQKPKQTEKPNPNKGRGKPGRRIRGTGTAKPQTKAKLPDQREAKQTHRASAKGKKKTQLGIKTTKTTSHHRNTIEKPA